MIFWKKDYYNGKFKSMHTEKDLLINNQSFSFIQNWDLEN